MSIVQTIVQQINLQVEREYISIFKELVNIARIPRSNFETVSKKFAQLQQKNPNRSEWGVNSHFCSNSRYRFFCLFKSCSSRWG